MKIAIIGASGKAGTFLTDEALRRGHTVTAIVRDGKKIKNPKARIVEKDLFALTYDDLKDHDVVVDAFAAWGPDVPKHQTSLRHLSGLLSGHQNIRLLVVGGAGSLYVDPQHTMRVMDAPGFPDAVKPLAQAMGAALEELQKTKDVTWTYLSPSANFVADGPRTGTYKTGGDELLVNSAGNSEISYADYAIAMIDEAERAKHVKKRFTVVSV